MSLCTGGEPAATTPRSPRSPRQWTAKNVLDAMTDALCNFLDVHYFNAGLSHDDMTAGAKAEEMYMDEIEPDGGKGKGKMVDYDFYDDDISAQDKLYAYEHIIRESSVENLPTHDLPPPAEMTEAPARKHWQQTLTSTTSEPLPAPASPAKAATKAAKKSAAKKPKKEKAAPSPSKAKAAQVPRAVALNKASTPSPAKSPAKAKLAKKASARIAVSVRI